MKINEKDMKEERIIANTMEWIMANKELPKKSGNYLHCFIGDDEPSIAYYDNDIIEFSWHSMSVKADHTQCWMELPKCK